MILTCHITIGINRDFHSLPRAILPRKGERVVKELPETQKYIVHSSKSTDWKGIYELLPKI